MLYFRVDMNEIIATGHVMRCLSIADAAKALGEDSTFISADEKSRELVEKRGYHSIILGTKWDDMESEFDELKKIINQYDIKKLFIDSYKVTDRYLSKVTEITKTYYLDDLNAFVYNVNCVVCYANYWKKFGYDKKYIDNKLLVGPSYAPLREAFSSCKKKDIKERTEKILLMSGGSDSYDILSKLLEGIDKEKYTDIDVICGMLYTKYDELCDMYREYENVHIHKSVSNMDEFMSNADIAVSAGGSTLYELCAMGTPTISYAFVDNQHNNVEQFDEDGIIEYAGDIRTDDIINNICNKLDAYYSDQKLRQEKSLLMQQVVDGKGARRIAEELLKE